MRPLRYISLFLCYILPHIHLNDAFVLKYSPFRLENVKTSTAEAPMLPYDSFVDTNRGFTPFSFDVANEWESLVPLWPGRGVDVRFSWKQGDNLVAVAAMTLDEVRQRDEIQRSISNDKMIQLKISLLEYMESFQSFCEEHLSGQEGYSARLVSSRGMMGTKCPVFHLDHVPCRWIQSVVGPGCHFVDQKDVKWDKINNLDGDALSPVERNQQLVSQNATIHLTRTGHAVVLAGNRWNDFCAGTSSPVAPVVHKSPELLPFQGRVLLTMEPIVPHHDN